MFNGKYFDIYITFVIKKIEGEVNKQYGQMGNGMKIQVFMP